MRQFPPDKTRNLLFGDSVIAQSGEISAEQWHEVHSDIMRIVGAQMASRIKQLVAELPALIEAELSNVRDGDGYWHGADACGEAVEELLDTLRAWRQGEWQQSTYATKKKTATT